MSEQHSIVSLNYIWFFRTESTQNFKININPFPETGILDIQIIHTHLLDQPLFRK